MNDDEKEMLSWKINQQEFVNKQHQEISGEETAVYPLKLQ